MEVVGQQHKRINGKGMFLPHGDYGFSQSLSAQVGAKPGVALVGDVGEEVERKA